MSFSQSQSQGPSEPPAPAWGQGAAPAQGNSGLGVASLVLAIVFLVVTMVTFAVAGYYKETMGADYNAKAPVVMIVGWVIILAMGGELLAFALGVASLFMAGRKKTLGIVGVVLSGLVGLGTLGLIILGLMIRSMRQ